MREIKFRGKRTDNGEWVEGYLTRRPSAIQYEAHYSPWFIDVPPRDPDDSGGFYNVDRATVGEFTGLSDRKGTKIFEGDILRDKFDFNTKYTKPTDHNYEVKYINGGFWLCKRRQRPIALCALFALCEVIGNIYDNPELIER